MSTFLKLLELYEGEGFSVRTGLYPLHFPGADQSDLPFTYFYKNGVRACKGGGIAITEILCIETLIAAKPPANILVIGNAFGWSTLALAVAAPGARVVALDWCPRQEEREGINLTNRLAKKAGLNAMAVEGKSPEDVASLAADYFPSPVDLVFIDGGHTNDQQRLDFDACKAVASADAVFLFHDVINFALTKGFVAIAADNPTYTGRILFRTPSGMAVLYPSALDGTVGRAASAFGEAEEHVRELWSANRERAAGTAA